MTLSQRVSGIIMPRLDGEHWANQAYRDNTYRLLDLGIRSFGVFKGEYEQTVAMIEDLQRRSGGQLLFGADFEFGLPMRITNRGISMPRAMALGRCQTTITERVAQAIAQEMRAMGILWNWAPVADINSNPDNPVINTRSFAEQPDTVSMHVKAWIAGQKGTCSLLRKARAGPWRYRNGQSPVVADNKNQCREGCPQGVCPLQSRY